MDRQICYLREVEYIITARFVLTELATSEDHPGRHANIFRRRARRGQAANPIYLGLPEYAATFEFIEPDDPRIESGIEQTCHSHLGWLPYDADGPPNAPTRYFLASLVNGVLNVPEPDEAVLTA